MLTEEDVSELLTNTAEALSRSWSQSKLEQARALVREAIQKQETGRKVDDPGRTTNTAGGKKGHRSRWDSDSDDDEHKSKKRKHKKLKGETRPELTAQSLSNGPCSSIEDYDLGTALSEGTYGVVFVATHKKTQQAVALKKIKYGEHKWDGFPVAALRETNVLFNLRHPNLVSAREMVVALNEHEGYPPLDVYMAMDYYKQDLYGALYATSNRLFQQSEVKLLMKQILAAVSYMHENSFMHRDLKLTNLLCNPGGHLVVCDFGMTRQFTDPPDAYTNEVVTLHYRAPELLLGVRDYNGPAVDLWSVGCIFVELLTKATLFPGDSVPGQLNLMWQELGTPTFEDEPRTRSWPAFANILDQLDMTIKPQTVRRLREKFPKATLIQKPYLSDVGFALLEGFLMLDPDKRVSAKASLEHPWFTQEEPRAKQVGELSF
jgi:cell division cycle 2-like protein